MEINNKNKLEELYDTNTSMNVLAYLMHHPLILQDDKYAFSKSDFDQETLHEILFTAIYNLAQGGVVNIRPIDIDTQINQSGSRAADYYKRNSGLNWLQGLYQAGDGMDKAQFDLCYNRIKKLSVLRDLERVGIDTRKFYDTTADILNRDKEDEKLNNTTVDQIINNIRTKIVEVENKNIGKNNGMAQDASKNMRQLVKELKEIPELGLPLDGERINWATRGAREGKMYLYSAPSGGGKTRYMVGNACAISMPYINEEGKIVLRNDYQRVLFVATEMQADEIQTLILAYVSGVNEEKILLGQYTPDEEERIKMALDIVDKYGKNFEIECIPDPSIAMVKARLIKYIVQDDIHYIFYDYIFSSPGLLSEFRDVAVREDVALMMLSNTLKEVAMEYNVFVQSATQLNDGWSKKEIGERDQNMIRGSKAIADKIDIGIIGVRLTDAEKKQIDAIWQEIKRQKEFTHDPNLVLDLYKNRRGKIAHDKIFRYFDFGTCRCEDLFITDSSYRALSEDENGKFEFEMKKIDYLDLKAEGVL